MGLMAIYNKSPIWVQNILTTLQGFRYKKRRFGKAYHSYIEELKKRDYTDFTAMQQYQNERVCELVNHAVNNSPFYKDFYKGLDIESIKTAEDLKKLGRVYRIISCTSLDKRSIKEAGRTYPRAEVTARNIPMDTDTLRKKLGVTSGDDAHIFGLKADTLGNLLIITV